MGRVFLSCPVTSRRASPPWRGTTQISPAKSKAIWVAESVGWRISRAGAGPPGAAGGSAPTGTAGAALVAGTVGSRFTGLSSGVSRGSTTAAAMSSALSPTNNTRLRDSEIIPTPPGRRG